MIAGLIRLITGVRANWIGVNPLAADGTVRQRIYFANHGSNLDAPVIWASLPLQIRGLTRPVAALDYWSATPLRRYLASRIFRCVLIERKRVTSHNNPLAAMEAALDAGESLIIFPEGTRTLDDDAALGTFKPGLWHLARRHPAAELVPVHLENMNRILPKGEFLLIPLLASVTFGNALEPLDGEDKQSFLDRAKRAIEELAERGQT